MRIQIYYLQILVLEWKIFSQILRLNYFELTILYAEKLLIKYKSKTFRGIGKLRQLKIHKLFLYVLLNVILKQSKN